MNDRARALAVLKEAREILLKRLTERVLENQEAILDDARGDSYMGEIDALYDQVGTPLVHLNQILSNLPAEDHDAPFETHSAPHPAAHSYAEIVPPAWPEVPGLPAPRNSNTLERTEDVSAPITFQTFAAQIQAEDVVGAGASLAYLFDIPAQRAVRCAEHFLLQMQQDPNFFASAMQLRRELATGGYNGAIMLLYQCFGLTGMESIGVYQALKTRIQAS
jgi:hypothetical protein